MIIAERKPLAEIQELLAGRKKVLLLGCGTCVTVCMAGGEKEVGLLAAELRMASRLAPASTSGQPEGTEAPSSEQQGVARQLAGEPVETVEETVQRQCEWEYIDALADKIQAADTVLSLACAIGVQAIAERFPKVRVVPALNTTFLGLPTEHGVWQERCQACGNCLLGKTGGVCPVARCSKSLMNGPCGGSQNGKCEVNSEIDCGWQLIYDRLSALGELEHMMEIEPPRDWRTSRDGGPRKIVREDLRA